MIVPGKVRVPCRSTLKEFSTDGPNKGKSVWVRAREIFEARMKRSNRQFGDSPSPTGPTTAWLQKTYNKSYTACGASGMSGGGSCI